MVSIPYTRKTFIWYHLSPKILDLSFDSVSLKYLWGVSYHMKFLRHERKTGNKKKLYTKKNCQLQCEEVESYWIMVRYYMLFAIFTLTSKWKHKQRNKQSTNTFSSNVFPYWQNPTKILLQWLVHSFWSKGGGEDFSKFFPDTKNNWRCRKNFMYKGMCAKWNRTYNQTAFDRDRLWGANCISDSSLEESVCQSTVKWQLTKKLGLGAEGGKIFFCAKWRLSSMKGTFLVKIDK